MSGDRPGWREPTGVFGGSGDSEERQREQGQGDQRRQEVQEVQMQTELLKAGVLTIDEVREMRGLATLKA